MSKLLIALGVVATLSAPAAAGRLDVDLTMTDGAAIAGGRANVDTNTETFVPRSIAPVQVDTAQDGRNAHEQVRDLQLFGANSR